MPFFQNILSMSKALKQRSRLRESFDVNREKIIINFFICNGLYEIKNELFLFYQNLFDNII